MIPVVSILAIVLTLLFPGVGLASACEPANPKGDSRKVLVPISHDALIKTTGGRTYKCSVVDHAAYDFWWELKCANGSTVTVGMQEPTASRGYSTYGLARDRSGRVFKMREYLDLGWRNYTCAQGIATSILSYQLSQDSFSFEVKIIVRYAQRIPSAPPAGF